MRSGDEDLLLSRQRWRRFESALPGAPYKSRGEESVNVSYACIGRETYFGRVVGDYDCLIWPVSSEARPPERGAFTQCSARRVY